MFLAMIKGHEIYIQQIKVRCFYFDYPLHELSMERAATFNEPNCIFKWLDPKVLLYLVESVGLVTYFAKLYFNK